MNKENKIISDLRDKYGDQKASKLIDYMDKILELNEHINLTAVREREEALQKHIIDSLSSTCCDEFKSAKRIVDMGTGAGFPGVPLAIVSDDKQFVLADSLNKRLKIINQLCDELEINNVTTLHGRAEDIGQDEDFRESFDVCVSRAVAALPILAEWCLPLVRVGGYMIAYKGANVSREKDEAENAIKVLGGKIVNQYEINKDSDEISGHVLLIIKKVKHTPKQYPRNPGVAKKKPL